MRFHLLFSMILLVSAATLAHAFASSVYFYRLNVQPTDGSASIAYVKKMMALK